MRKFSKVVAFILVLVLMSATFVVSAATPENYMPEDVFANQTNYNEWFKVVNWSENETVFSKDGDDYVVHIPWIVGNGQTTAWQASTQSIPYSSYTVKMEIQPIEGKDADGNPRYFGCGIMLGYGDGNGGGFPWMDCRFNFNYELEVVEWYVWEHIGNDLDSHDYSFGWFNGFEFPEDLWFEVIIEVTPDATTFYLNGDEVPLFDDGFTPKSWSLGHYPTSNDLKWIGFLPEGSGKDKTTGEVNAPSTGFNVKNMGIYEGVNLGLFEGDDVADETEEPADETEAPADETEAPSDVTEAPSDETEIPSDETEEPADETEDPSTDEDESEGDKGNKKSKGPNVGLIIGIVAAVVVVAAGAVVAVILIKKKKK